MSGWFDEGLEKEKPRKQPGAPHSAHDASQDSANDSAPGSANRAEGASGSTDDPGPDDRFERYRVKGDDLLSRVKELVREGNVRKITIRNDEDRVLLSFPLAAGVLGAALLPMWAAIGAVAALVGNCSIEVERRE